MSALLVFLPAQPISAATEFEYALTQGRQHRGSPRQRPGRAPARADAGRHRSGGGGARGDAVLAPGRTAQGHFGGLAPACAPCWRACWKTSCSTNRTPCTLPCSPRSSRRSRFGWRSATAAGCAAPCRCWRRPDVRLPASCRSSRPKASRRCTRWAIRKTLRWFWPAATGVMSLPLSSQALALLPSLPEDTPCVAEPAVAALAEQVLHRPPVLQQAPQRWLQAAQSDWDLAQFEFSSSGRARALKKLGTAWADVLAAPAVAARALGRAAAGGGQSRRTERLGLARAVGAGRKARSDTPAH